MSSNKRLRLSYPSFVTPGASTSTSFVQTRFKYDVFISFRGEDTRKTFVSHLYEALKQKGIQTYKDDEKMKQGKTIDNQLVQAIRDSRFFIIVFSKSYASSSWCLDELVEIMDRQKSGKQTAYPVFFDVEPTQVRKQSGTVKDAFAKHEKNEAAEKWAEALKEVSNLAGWELKAIANGHEAKFIKKIVEEISLELRFINFGFDEKLVGMETRVKDVVSSLEVGIDVVRMLGIKGMGGAGKTTTARAVFDHLCADFEAKIFVENVREVSKASMFGLKNLQEQVLSKMLKEQITLDSVNDGKNMMKRRMCHIKVLLVLDDVDHIDQLEALAGEPNWFKHGSRIIITTRDEQVLEAHRVNLIRDIDLLLDKEAICLFSKFAFGRETPSQVYEELSRKVVRYAAGLPLTVKVLGSFLCGKNKDEWTDAIKRLEKIPLKETLEKLELSYMSLEDDYKEIFLDIACILKGKSKEDAIRILECCGFHARIGLKVLQQRSLITIEYGGLGMHDHIEEMGKNIVRRSHLDEPNKHSRLWISEEIEDILANNMGTKATRCLRLDMSRGNSRILMNGLRKMKKLRYLDVNFVTNHGSNIWNSNIWNSNIQNSNILNSNIQNSDIQNFDDTSQYFPNSLKYLKCSYYPFLYLPKTFQPENLVGLEMELSRRLVQLWEDGEKKVLKKIKFILLRESNLTTFDFRITPNLETLSLNSFDLKELCMPVSCQKLKYLCITNARLITFNLGLTPNIETLSLRNCADFEELHVPFACLNFKFLDLSFSRLGSLDLELIPNLERLDLRGCDKLVKINAPVGCLKKVAYLDLRGCLRFPTFVFGGGCEPKVNCSSATLQLFGESLDLCRLHPNSNLPKFRFQCDYEEYLPSSVGNIEKLISFGLCACTDLKKFSDIICSLQCLQKLTLNISNIPVFPQDLGQLKCLEELCLYSEKIKYLPDSICMLKRLKFLRINNGYPIVKLPDDLEKLPEDLGQLDSLEKLFVSSKKIEYLPDSICMLKHLKWLYVTDCCRLGKLPNDIGQLESLERLVLTATRTKHLPDSVCMLKHLKFLNVSFCDLLEKLPENLGQLECLEELYVNSKKIEYLPGSICMLKRLKWLTVTECCLLKLPENIGQLESLEILDLSATMIKHIPNSICMLKHLKFLNLSHCALLEKVPEI